MEKEGETEIELCVLYISFICQVLGKFILTLEKACVWYIGPTVHPQLSIEIVFLCLIAK